MTSASTKQGALRPPRSACCCRTASRRSAGRRRIARDLAAGVQERSATATASSTPRAAPRRSSPRPQQCLTNGAKVHPARQPRLRLAVRRSRSSPSQGAPRSIDYDRLTLKGSASYYVSFNNVTVGKLQGQGLVNCLKASGAIRTSRRHRRAERLADRQQRDAVRAGLQLGPEPAVQERARSKKGPNQSVPQLGQPEGADDLPGHARRRRATRSTACSRRTTASATRSISALKSRRPQADPGHRPGRDRAGRPEHPRRLAVRDRLQVDPARRPTRPRRSRSASCKGKPVNTQRQIDEQRQAQRAVGAPDPDLRSRRTTGTCSSSTAS